MKWRCPLCDTPIRYHAQPSELHADKSYRCHVCRVDLTIGGATGELVMIQLDENRSAQERPSCPTCGKNATVVGPLFVELPGTLDMIAQYFCSSCLSTLQPVQPHCSIRRQ
jgi:transposase-like protein